jgi:PTH1 family peptidyl-tRNA hydrolase
MNLIVGLGNPGEKYASTRHNIGFMVIDQVLKDLVSVENTWSTDSSIKTHVFKNGDLVFAKPQTFMNGSGFAVKKLVDLYKVRIESIWVIHDDIDLPLGKMRIRNGGGSAGHHGVESIMRELGGRDGFVRFRLGVGRGKLDDKNHPDQNLKRHSVEKYVVSHFTTHEEGEVRKLIKHAAKAVETALHQGLDKAMNQYN